MIIGILKKESCLGHESLCNSDLMQKWGICGIATVRGLFIFMPKDANCIIQPGTSTRYLTIFYNDKKCQHLSSFRPSGYKMLFCHSILMTTIKTAKKDIKRTSDQQKYESCDVIGWKKCWWWKFSVTMLYTVGSFFQWSH